MSYISVRSLVSMGMGVLLLVIYVIYALGEAAPAPGDLRSWALLMLIFIGACIVAGIIIQIVFHIALAIGISVKEKGCEDEKVERIIKSSMFEDERYKLISLRSSRVGYCFAGFAFVAGLVALVVGLSTVLVLHIVAGVFAMGAFVEGCMIVYLNERGVRNG